jgi:hypothetical protein
MSKTLYSLTIVLVILLIACKAKNENIDRKKIENEIRTTITNYYNDIRKEGPLAEFKYLDSSEDFFWTPPGYSTPIDYDSVSAFIRKNAPLFKSLDNSLDTAIITPLADEYAQIFMKTNSTIVDTSGNTSHHSFIETGVMVRRIDGWKFLSGQTSLISQ